MKPFKLKTKKKFTLIAVSKSSALFALQDRTIFLQEVKKKLVCELEKRGFPNNLEKTIVICPWEWQAPEDFASPQEVLVADSWNAVCMHICTAYGSFKYGARRSKSVHMVTADGEVALFQFTAMV